METSYLKIVKSLSPEFAYPNFTEFIDNLNSNDLEWYNSFRVHVTEKLDLELYTELFGEGVRSLLPVRTLVAMMIMKQGFGWSDSQLVQECKKDVSVRHALGITAEGDVPSVLMLNKFRAALSNHESQFGFDLYAVTVEELTTEDGPVTNLGEGKIMLRAMRVA